MKTCQNCRCVYADDYNGQCSECGAPMGGTQANGNNGLQFAFARQVQQGADETGMERQMRAGKYDRVKLEDSMVEVAKNFVTFNRERWIANGGDPNEAL